MVVRILVIRIVNFRCVVVIGVFVLGTSPDRSVMANTIVVRLSFANFTFLVVGIGDVFVTDPTSVHISGLCSLSLLLMLAQVKCIKVLHLLQVACR